MEQTQFATLPEDVRRQMLVEAPYDVISELCQEPIFKKICNDKQLWQMKLEKEFGITDSRNPKLDYIENLRFKLRTIIDDRLRLINQTNEEAKKEIQNYARERKEEAGREINERYNQLVIEKQKGKVLTTSKLRPILNALNKDYPPDHTIVLIRGSPEPDDIINQFAVGQYVLPREIRRLDGFTEFIFDNEKDANRYKGLVNKQDLIVPRYFT